MLDDVRLPITEVMGLPLHPLVVHGAVVLLPLAAFGFIVMFSRGARSVRYSPAVLFVSALALLMSVLAAMSGRELAGPLGLRGADHFEFGEYVPWVALALFVATAALAAIDKRAKGTRSALAAIIGVAGFAIALVAIGLVVYVGHTGAELVWGT